MTVKITQVSTTTGEVTLTIAYDNPAGSGTMFAFALKKQDLFERLRRIRELLGRPLTLQDAKLALLVIINELRAGRISVPEDFNFGAVIDVELEPSP
ncbi:MAG: hypothetical protein NWE95_00640 [Candidatus Bathyarchaeota archaeon]|nr:hypothetical protein [Candidatus Bathyarchaeota archaeon]